jgi:hypothetical protein
MTTTEKGGRPIGSAKTGGRQKGTPNRATLTIREKLEAMGCDPIVEFAKIAMNEKNEIDVRMRCLDKIAPYIYPKLKPVDMSSDEPLVINVITKIDPGGSDGGSNPGA